MKEKYIVMKTEYEAGAQTRYGYGIALTDGEEEFLVLDSVEDLADDREAVSHLVELCNRLELDPIHLRDVAEDFLAAV